MPQPNRSMSRNMAVLTLAVMAACSSDNAQQSTTVNLYQVSREDLPINVKEGGELVAVNETVVRSAIEGNATVLYLIPEGTSVSKGEKLVELDVSDLVEKRATQEISVEKARNALEQAKTAQDILEKELQANINTAESQRRIATMELEKLLGAKGGRGSEGKNADMVKRLEELVNPAPSAASEDASPASGTEGAPTPAVLVTQVHPQNYAGLVNKVVSLLKVKGEAGDPLERDMGEMANLILQQADQIRLAMADLKVKEDTAAHSRSLAQKQFITRNELERDELAYQSQASKVTIAWNDLELLVNYTLERDKIEKGQNVENAELEVARVAAKNGAERRNSQFDVDAKKKEFEVAAERLANLEKQIGNSVLVSPGEGLVVYSKVSRGRGDSEPVEEGTSVRERQSIIILPDNSKLECKIQVQEAMIDKVRVGMAALISAEVRPNEVMTGRVTYVAPVADSQSRWSGNDKKVYTTKVLLDGINKDESLKAGMKAAATITVGSIKDALTVPIQAVRRDRAVNYIWKQSENGPVAVAVKVGANNEEKVEILSGLAEGDMIYRTPPGGQADPKFDQPAMPEAAPMESAIEGSGAAMPAAAAAAAGAGGRPAKAAQASSRRGAAGGGRPQGSRSARKKFADMDAAELAQAKKDLPKMLDRFSAYLSEEKLVEANKMVGEIEKALDAGETEKADRLRSTGLRKLMSGGSAGRRGNE